MIEKFLHFFKSLPFSERIKLLPFAIFIVYVLGFLVWNIYLSQFGIFESNFLQTRYLSSGILGLIFISFVVLFFLTIIRLINRIKAKKSNNQITDIFSIKKMIMIEVSVMTFIILFLLFVLFIFPQIPQYFGGAAPVSASLIGSAEQMHFLENFNVDLVPNAEGKEAVQTYPMCILYQNQDYILIGVRDWKNTLITNPKFTLSRVLYLRISQILGFQFGEPIANKNFECNAADFYNYKSKKVDIVTQEQLFKKFR